MGLGCLFPFFWQEIKKNSFIGCFWNKKDKFTNYKKITMRMIPVSVKLIILLLQFVVLEVSSQIAYVADTNVQNSFTKTKPLFKISEKVVPLDTVHTGNHRFPLSFFKSLTTVENFNDNHIQILNEVRIQFDDSIKLEFNAKIRPSLSSHKSLFQTNGQVDKSWGSNEFWRVSLTMKTFNEKMKNIDLSFKLNQLDKQILEYGRKFEEVKKSYNPKDMNSGKEKFSVVQEEFKLLANILKKLKDQKKHLIEKIDRNNKNWIEFVPIFELKIKDAEGKEILLSEDHKKASKKLSKKLAKMLEEILHSRTYK